MSAANEAVSTGALPVVRVEGDPRAMGEAQGRACREAIRRVLSDAGVARRGRWPIRLLPFAGGPVLGRGMGREIVRHYPHLSERIQGIARGSGASIESLVELFVRAAQGRVDVPVIEPVPAAARAGGEPLLCRPLARGDWIVRESRPEVGFPSLELTLPWLTSAVAGVNEAGVAAVVAPIAAGGGGRAPSLLLLVQECLQRFDDLAGCVDWCRKRPFSGRGCLLIADASGAVAAVTLEDGARRVAESRSGVLAGGGCEERHPELCKSLSAAGEAGLDDALPEMGTRVAVSASDRSLRVWTDAGAPQRFTVG